MASTKSSARRQPEQQAPPAQRLRVRYAKRGPARFTSHRDFSRAFERALRRAEIPMAYSSGFTPHPRISYANASPTGAATEAEYLEIGLSEVCDPEKVHTALAAVLPPGLPVLDVVQAGGGSMADALAASAWTIELDAALSRELLESAVAELLARDQVLVQRMTKSGLREFDVREAIVSLVVADDRTVQLVSRHGAPLVRPDDVVQALGVVSPELAQAGPALLTRLHQGAVAEQDGRVRLVDPFTGVQVAPFGTDSAAD